LCDELRNTIEHAAAIMAGKNSSLVHRVIRTALLDCRQFAAICAPMQGAAKRRLEPA
jgi:hypothetical protein